MGARPHAFFLRVDDGPDGARFCVADVPAAGRAAPRASVLLAPPFAEEMNKSRRMLALQARALADAGCTVLRPDLMGCGDSAGEFAQANWQRWLDDLEAGASWLRARAPDAPLVLWGLRAGCLLARDLADRLARPPAALLAWQPPADGRALLQQFLRLKVYGDAMAAPQPGAMEQIKAELAAGRSVTVAGYRLSPALADGLGHATWSPPSRPPLASVWLELSMRADATPAPALQRAAERWVAAGHRVEHRVVAGPAFWAAVEIEEAPALVEATAAALASCLDNPA